MIPALLARVRLRVRPDLAHPKVGSRNRSARAGVLAGVILTLAAMLGMSGALETVKPEWRDPEFGHRLILLRRHRGGSPDRPLVLALGTSRTQNAIAPGAMGFPNEAGSPLVFNFGQSGSPPLKVLLTLLRLLDEGIRPDAVILEVLPDWLAADGPAERMLRDAEPRLSAGDLRRLAPYCADSAALERKWIAARLAPWSAQRVVLMSHWLPRWLKWGERIDPQWDGMEADGFVPYPEQFATSEFRAIATAHAKREHAGSFAGYRFGESSLRAIRDLVARCRGEGIAVLSVEPPVSPMFRDWFRPGVWASGEERLGAFAGELGVELVSPFNGLEESDFVDGHHMLRSGAEKYSRWLADAHLRAWLARHAR
jgi:hypothetical protein